MPRVGELASSESGQCRACSSFKLQRYLGICFVETYSFGHLAPGYSWIHLSLHAFEPWDLNYLTPETRTADQFVIGKSLESFEF